MKFLEMIALLIFYILVVILWALAILGINLGIKSNNDIMVLLSSFYVILAIIWTILAVFLTILRKYL